MFAVILYIYIYLTDPGYVSDSSSTIMHGIMEFLHYMFILFYIKGVLLLQNWLAKM